MFYPILVNSLVLFIAFLHVYFLVLEMFLWTKPFGLKVFGQSYEQASHSKILAQNQGLYNGFLAAGLVYGVFAPFAPTAFAFKIFFLICVCIAGIFAGITVSKRIFYVQALPAIVTLLIIVLEKNL